MDSNLSSFVTFNSAKQPTRNIHKIPNGGATDIKFLTAREIEVLELLGTGLSVKGSARELAISPGTVKWHVKNIYIKLGASSREDALSKLRLQKII